MKFSKNCKHSNNDMFLVASLNSSCVRGNAATLKPVDRKRIILTTAAPSMNINNGIHATSRLMPQAVVLEKPQLSSQTANWVIKKRPPNTISKMPITIAQHATRSQSIVLLITDNTFCFFCEFSFCFHFKSPIFIIFVINSM